MNSSRSAVLLGLDLSLTASAAVACPLDWDGDFRRVQSLVIGEKLDKGASLAERAHRTERIASRLVAFARSVGATRCWIEQYAFSQANAAHSLGELGGVVKLALVSAGIEIHTVTASQARKLLLGVNPRKGAKVAVAKALRAAGAQFDTLDEYDAMAVLNFGLAEAGGYCFAQGEAA